MKRFAFSSSSCIVDSGSRKSTFMNQRTSDVLRREDECVLVITNKVKPLTTDR